MSGSNEHGPITLTKGIDLPQIVAGGLEAATALREDGVESSRQVELDQAHVEGLSSFTGACP